MELGPKAGGVLNRRGGDDHAQCAGPKVATVRERILYTVSSPEVEQEENGSASFGRQLSIGIVGVVLPSECPLQVRPKFLQYIGGHIDP